MKRIISLLLAVLLFSASSFSVLATNIEIVDDIDLSSEYVNEYEEKIYCNATIEDDFTNDSVIVVLKNKNSLEF